MQALKLQKFPAGSVLLLASGLTLVGACLSFRYGDINATPLPWLVTLVVTPLVSVGCVAGMYRQTNRPRWTVALGTVLTLPQILVRGITVRWTLHYLGFLK